MSRFCSRRMGTILLAAGLVAAAADAASAQAWRGSVRSTVGVSATILPLLRLPTPRLSSSPSPGVHGSMSQGGPVVLTTGEVSSAVAWTLAVEADEGGAAGAAGLLQWRDDADAWRHLPPDATLHRSGTGRMDVQMRFPGRPDSQGESRDAADAVRLRVRIEYSLAST